MQDETSELNVETGTKRKRQPDIRNSINESAHNVYLKMMRTAYQMALTPSMPHSHFQLLVKCQRDNGVRLVEGKQNNKAGIDHC